MKFGRGGNRREGNYFSFKLNFTPFHINWDCSGEMFLPEELLPQEVFIHKEDPPPFCYHSTRFSFLPCLETPPGGGFNAPCFEIGRSPKLLSKNSSKFRRYLLGAVEERDVMKVGRPHEVGAVAPPEVRDGIWGKCARAVFSFCGCLFVQHLYC
ncbi:hypothetical protein CDAR_294531 [Caerostris darwini]|uniref:Uncharacterized protein n=1 Tax=Caerostris darwini TaxID=1538125 RepID=A0AAV4UKF4_9ARAC|nr:hypothetical protein CDAR_294531 [Caerostris darwini]